MGISLMGVDWFELVQLFSAVCAGGLACGVLTRIRRSAAGWALAAGLLFLALERLCHLFCWRAPSVEEMVEWVNWGLVCMALVPGAWIVFGAIYARGGRPAKFRGWLWLSGIFTGVLLVFALVFRNGLTLEAAWSTEIGNWLFRLGWPARVLHAGFVVGSLLGLMNLEWTFRASVGSARWKIKYAVFGAGLLLGERLYTSAQAILYSATRAQFIFLDAVGLVLACVMLGVSFYRSKLASIDIYPSTAVLQRSVSVLLVAGYLVVMGVLAWVFNSFGGARALPITGLMVLLAIVGVGIVLASDRVRHAARRLVSQHFKRPLHDYRDVWAEFTKRTAGIVDRTGYARAVAGLISDVFEALSVTVWLHEKTTSSLVLSASTVAGVETGQGEPLPSSVVQSLTGVVGRTVEPFDIDDSPEPWCEVLRQSNPGLFKKGGHRYCVPLVTRGELEGVIILGDRVMGVGYTVEDFELLKQLANHIAVGLQSISLYERVAQAREMEAFQVMSAFLVHDLKNTLSSLTLTVRNMSKHFDNPAFREDALRSLEHSAAHISELVARLTALRQGLRLQLSLHNLNKIVMDAVRSLGDDGRIAISLRLSEVPEVMLDAKRFESVVLNLLLNAREASLPGSEIIIETGKHENGVYVAIRDHGCGMSEEFIANSLFKPFRTTKKNGLGIGMYQAKAIVEAHRGRITVQSELGRGTLVRVWIPLCNDRNYEKQQASVVDSR
ncbi:MAG: PEP-CTERM system histidine kinase PrsK [Verrucomicrobiae bacterium]|nr:PEP-CTERM system histidine kinase PrsK [Verrucomicrobiae bacterium]